MDFKYIAAANEELNISSCPILNSTDCNFFGEIGIKDRE